MTFQPTRVGLPCPDDHHGCALALRVVNLGDALRDVAALAHDLHRAGRISPGDADRIAVLCDAPTAGDLLGDPGRRGSYVTAGAPEPGPYSINGHVTRDLH